jgi:beta-N-acetylhexosaminidase
LIDKSMRKMIGQMIMVGFKEAELTEDSPIVRAIKEFSLGSVILYNLDLMCFLEEQKKRPDMTRHEAAGICPRNIISPDQLKVLTSHLQGYSKSPLLIAVDQEGGLVSRLDSAAGFTEAPSPKTLGEQDDLTATTRAASAMAADLSRNGINLNLAPVVDLNLNPQGLMARNGRSFGSDPKLVYRHAQAFILAHREQGILTCLKHFPGKGSAGKDMHFEVADVTTSYQPQEIHPFFWLIEEGLGDTVMTSHIHHLGWDKKYPITLSPRVLRGLLREELRYQGVIISDDLLMGAIVNRFGLEESCLLAVEAGVDILLASNNSPEGYDPNLFMRIFEALIKAVESGRISKARIETSHARIMALKGRLENT